MLRGRILIGFVCLLIGGTMHGSLEAGAAEPPRRADAEKAMAAGNFKDAYEQGFLPLASNPNDEADRVGDDLRHGIDCLRNLGRDDEIDDFREKTVSIHAKNWRLLAAAAESLNGGQTWGFIVAGKFYRGFRHGGGGRQVSVVERDRVRALQLMLQAAPLTGAEPDREAVGKFYLRWAEQIMLASGGGEAWKLQELTDLSTLPDYSDMQYFADGGRGAPVNADGSPVFYSLPATWDAATSDGQRLRWVLGQAKGASKEAGLEAELTWGRFLYEQFGVQTLVESGYGMLVGRGADVGPADQEHVQQEQFGPFAVRTLKDPETIVRLANGVRRVTLPDEFNPIKVLQALADEGKSAPGEAAMNLLAQMMEDRQQYDRAADLWRQTIAAYGPGDQNWRQARLEQIVGNWASFDTVRTQAAGAEPELYLLFRNARKVSFTATRIDVEQLLADVRASLAGHRAAGQLQWEELNVENLGYRLVEKDEKKYLGEQAAHWEMALQPADAHFDRRSKVVAPLKKGGAYLVVGKVEGGNVARVIVWLADAVIAKKPLETGAYYFAGDAISGAPIANAKLDLFGFRQIFDGKSPPQIQTASRALQTDADGGATLVVDANPAYQWLATLHTADGRFAYHGFSSIWSPGRQSDPSNQTRVFVITDRPVYRPGQTAKYKLWISTPSYDREGPSDQANKTFVLQVRDPRGQKLLERPIRTDEFGGVDGEVALPADATLGVYQLFVPQFGGSSFRVEEYKKPEFEVTVDAPKEPVALGDKVTATITAKYYFGTPVTEGKLHVKVMRQPHDTRWFPAARWDWFYEPGYWWFASDYAWYPGWSHWGMRAPARIWFQFRQAPPELVLEQTSPLNADGTLKIDIDTSLAKALHGDEDHEYTVSAEVTDASRRTISGSGRIIVARQPFKVYAWLDRGYYQTGDVIEARLSAQTADRKPVAGAHGSLKLLRVSYDAAGKASEQEIDHWDLPTDAAGNAQQQMKAAQPGQYRISYTVTDDKGKAIEGGYLFVVRGEGFDGRSFRFNDIELVTDKKEYQPGDDVRLMINTERADSTVVLFLRPVNGTYLPPQVLRLHGKSSIQQVAVAKADMPNFFIEAMTISNAAIYDQTREVVVPPEQRVLNVEVLSSAQKFKPGEKGTISVRVTDATGAPVSGSTVIAVYDKALEYISGGSNIPDIREFFWKWRRSHYPRTESSLDRQEPNLSRSSEVPMRPIGALGGEEEGEGVFGFDEAGFGGGHRGLQARAAFGAPMAPGSAILSAGAMAKGAGDRLELRRSLALADGAEAEGAARGVEQKPLVEPTVRTNLADTALWVGQLTTNADGTAQVPIAMPENLTTWRAKAWTISSGTRVGQGDTDVTTYKNLIVRLQSPRFFIQKDQVVLSANVHNYLATEKQVKVTLDLGRSGTLALLDPATAEQTALIPASGEHRIDWRVQVMSPGTADIRVAALTDEESDAMQQSFPVYVHGMLKTDSYSAALRPDEQSSRLSFRVPAERLVEQSRLEIRYSPSVASAMVDALPYLVDYPYDCTEQTLNRFLPTVITQKVLLSMNLDLKQIQAKRTNLNAQEIGDDAARAADWKRNNPPNPGQEERNPVFDEAVVADMTREGINRLASMQCGDGGWGWFSGIGEKSWPHTTALVVHGLQIARANGVALPPNLPERGQQWLVNYQSEQIKLLKNAPTKTEPYKLHADDLDAFVFMVLTDGGVASPDMLNYLYADRNEIGVYSKAMFGLALKKLNEADKLQMILQNLSQYLVEDKENQTAYLRLPEQNPWWCWYGSDIEAMGYTLKLLSQTDPRGATAAHLAKYLINNRKHASYWNSTRDTAICVEALADFIRASGEASPNLDLTLTLDGKPLKQVHIDATNLFTFDNKLVMQGADLTAGDHLLEVSKAGNGSVYYNAYLTNFTLEDPITRAGLEVRVQRKLYKLLEVEKTASVSGDRGQAIRQHVEKYQREPLPDGAVLKSGDLVEVELEIDSKNDYEYILFEDMKAAGFEPLDVRSGYNGNDLGAYMELRDNRVSFFARSLPRGKHSVSYRLRAETPGRFSALPARASAMYAPELKGNSDEQKVEVRD